MDNYVILVNTTDSYEDCWGPFFKLFSIYWPDFKGKIYLNTETKDFSYPGLNILPVKNAAILQNNADKATWSQCLYTALNVIDSDIILYMQEDYFLKGRVKNDLVSNYANIIAENKMDCIHLTDQSACGPFHSSEFEDLWVTDRKAPFLISCQAALWKREALKKHIRVHESPWQFEFYGSRRGQLFKSTIYTINRDKYMIGINEIIPYVFTGVTDGKWYKEVPALFEKHHIAVDYSIRGFVRDRKPQSFFLRVRWKIRMLPNTIKSNFEIISIRYLGEDE